MYVVRYSDGGNMNFRNMTLATALLASCTTIGLCAQTAKQDMKDAGHSTANASKSAGKGVAKGTKKAGNEVADKTEDGWDATKHGTKKAAKATAHGTEVAATKTARGTKSVAKKIVGDDTPTTTPHDPPKKY